MPELAAALLDLAGRLAARAAVFLIDGRALRLAGVAGYSAMPGREIEVPLAAAPAFENAVQSLDCVVAMHSPGELSSILSEALPAPERSRAAIIPIVSRGRSVAALYAENGSEPADLAPLEILAELAGCALDARDQNLAAPRAAGLVTIGSPATGNGGGEWEALSVPQRDLHIRAQRLARVQVGEIRLRRSQAIKEGRAESDLYGRLRQEIDAARAAFQHEFIDGNLLDVDYFHQELVHTLANDDEALLGPQYPGPLV